MTKSARTLWISLLISTLSLVGCGGEEASSSDHLGTESQAICRTNFGDRAGVPWELSACEEGVITYVRLKRANSEQVLYMQYFNTDHKESGRGGAIHSFATTAVSAPLVGLF